MLLKTYLSGEVEIVANGCAAHFVVQTLMSVMHDLAYGSPGMKSVTDFMTSDALGSRGAAEALSRMREKPLVRCENCTKSPEELGRNQKFMVCSICKSKLDFVVHYCSQYVSNDYVANLGDLTQSRIGRARERIGPITRSIAGN